MDEGTHTRQSYVPRCTRDSSCKNISDTPNTVLDYFAHPLKDKEKEAARLITKIIV